MDFESSRASEVMVQARFNWAIRRGRRLWLWPELEPRYWEEALRRIEAVLAAVLAGRKAPILEGDAHALGIAGYTSGMGPLLGYWLDAGVIEADPPIHAVFKSHFDHNHERMRRLATYATQAVNEITAAGVEVTILKGMHTAFEYFPLPGTRPVSDIDLLVSSTDLPIAINALRSLSYERKSVAKFEQDWRLIGSPQLPVDLELVHRDDPWGIDLHNSLDRRYTVGAPLLQVDRALCGSSAHSLDGFPNAKILAGTSLCFYLALHASCHLSGLSMIRLTELIFVVRDLNRKNDLDWDEYLSLADRTGTPGFSYPALKLVEILAPGTVPVGILSRISKMVPPKVISVIAPLRPASGQQIVRFSFKERYLWTGTVRGWIREVGELVLPNVPRGKVLSAFRSRFWRAIRLTLEA